MWIQFPDLIFVRKNERRETLTSEAKMCWKFSLLPFLLLLFSFSASLHAQLQNTWALILINYIFLLIIVLLDRILFWSDLIWSVGIPWRTVAFVGIVRDRVGRNEEFEIGFGRRALLSFKETPQGSNVTFECSRSGPCVACLYSEKVSISLECSLEIT